MKYRVQEGTAPGGQGYRTTLPPDLRLLGPDAKRRSQTENRVFSSVCVKEVTGGVVKREREGRGREKGEADYDVTLKGVLRLHSFINSK